MNKKEEKKDSQATHQPTFNALRYVTNENEKNEKGKTPTTPSNRTHSPETTPNNPIQDQSTTPTQPIIS